MKAINYFEKYRKLTNQCLNDIKKIFKKNKTDKVELYYNCDEENVSNPLVLPFYDNNGDVYNDKIQSIYVDEYGTVRLKGDYGDYDLVNDSPRENYIFVYEALREIFNID